MKRRDFISAVGAVVAWPFAARARQQERSQNAGGLEEAKHRFDKISQPSEAARSDYVTRLVRIREEMARQKNDEWKAIDNEIGEHPAPKDSDAKVLSRRLVGKWSSPRHDYLYRRDGSWTMLPADEGTTHGTWRIEGNQFPHHVDLMVPERGFGKRLDDMHEWHRMYEVPDVRGQGRRENGRDIIRWCFADRKMATLFAKTFGGVSE